MKIHFYKNDLIQKAIIFAEICKYFNFILVRQYSIPISPEKSIIQKLLDSRSLEEIILILAENHDEFINLSISNKIQFLHIIHKLHGQQAFKIPEYFCVFLESVNDIGTVT